MGASRLQGRLGLNMSVFQIKDVIKHDAQSRNLFNQDKPIDVSVHILSYGMEKECIARLIPFECSEETVIRLIQPKSARKNSSQSPSKTLKPLYAFSDLLGSSPEFTKAKQLAARFAATPRNILLLGESGTGKELFAHAIHNSSCPHGPFVAVNCASLPRGLVESELFGYEAGSFTGADPKGKAGKLEMAHEGTLFLDEIGDMPMGFQATLLRVLEEKRVMRIGGNQYLPADFRVIAATNKNLEELIHQKQFREDLYYRLSSLKLFIPSLRNRKSDIPLLVRHFIQQQCQEYNLPVPAIESNVDKALISYHWPGNIRELQNIIGMTLSLAENGVIKLKDLPPEIFSSDLSYSNELKTMDQLEEQSIRDAMINTGFNIKRAALALGISRTTLYSKMKKYNIRKN